MSEACWSGRSYWNDMMSLFSQKLPSMTNSLPGPDLTVLSQALSPLSHIPLFSRKFSDQQFCDSNYRNFLFSATVGSLTFSSPHDHWLRDSIHKAIYVLCIWIKYRFLPTVTNRQNYSWAFYTDLGWRTNVSTWSFIYCFLKCLILFLWSYQTS